MRSTNPTLNREEMAGDKNMMMKRFRNNRKGIAWVIGTAVLSLFLMPVVYFPLSMAWDQTATAITGTYEFTGSAASALIVVQFIISYALIFGLLFTIAWAITNAKAKRYEA
jgi:hypothetical protein